MEKVKEIGEEKFYALKINKYLTYSEYLRRLEFYEKHFEKFSNIKIEKLGLSARSSNGLKKNNIINVDDLIELGFSELIKTRNIGSKSVCEILDSISIESLSSLLKSGNATPYNEDNINDSIYSIKMPKIISKQLRDMGIHTIGEFLKLDGADLKLSISTMEKFNGIKNKLISHYPDFYSTCIRELLDLVPEENYKYYINFFFNKKTANILNQFNVITIGDFVKHDLTFIENTFLDINLVITKLKTLQKPLLEYLYDEFNYALIKRTTSKSIEADWQRNLEILSHRALGFTLQEIGDAYDSLSRERIRQIERTKQQVFNKVCCNNFLKAYLGGESDKNGLICLDKLKECYAEKDYIFAYLLKNSNCDWITYNEIIPCFIIGEDWTLEIEKYLDKQDNMIYNYDIQGMYDDCKKALDRDFSFEIFIEYFNKFYVQNGKIYSKNKLTLLRKYKIILNKFYKNGIKVYDDCELDEFRKHYNKLFNDSKCPNNNRALQGRIIDNCILRDRGYYMPKKDSYISEDLYDKILKFIYASEQDVLMYNQIMVAFEDELSFYGIDNRYYLQGVLREKYNEKANNMPLYFTKDYVSRTKDASNIHTQILSAFKNAKGIVSLDDIMKTFVGVPENVIIQNAFVSEIIPLFNRNYIHIDNIHIYNEEIDIIKQTILRLTNNNQIINDETLHVNISIKCQDFIERNDIQTAYFMFGIARSLFSEDFQFKRPFIANNNVVIESREERIKSLIYPNEKVYLDNTLNEIYEQGINVMSFNNILININKDYYRTSFNTLELATNILINKYQIEEIERHIINLMRGKKYISYVDITDFSFFPKINREYNHWLLSSILRDKSENIKIIPVSNNYKISCPIYTLSSLNINSIDELIEKIVLETNMSFEEVVEENNLFYQVK